jgi:hypothetical protein
MSTGLTFGTIAALYGLTNEFIDQPTYTILVTVVILSAVVPTLIATTFFEPEPTGEEGFEDFEAAEEMTPGRCACRLAQRGRAPTALPTDGPESVGAPSHARPARTSDRASGAGEAARHLRDATRARCPHSVSA